MTATLTVCITCRMERPLDAAEERPGARLFAALAARGVPRGVTLRKAECLSACKRGCSVALQGPGKWTYVYGWMDPDSPEDHVGQIIEGAAAYATSADGIVPWRERPAVFRKQSLARVPPVPHAPADEPPTEGP